VTGWETGGVTSAFVLFLMATAWAILPAFVDLNLGFPRSWVTVGLATLAWLLTLFAWIDSFDGNFSIWALLGFLAATAILLCALLALLSEMRHRRPVAGGPAETAQWVHQPASDFSRQQGGPQQPYGGYGQPTHSYQEQAPQPYSTPPPPPPAVPPHAVAPPPPPPGGSTASGEGSGTPGSGERPAD
jgi:hypothetical protein